MTRLPVPAFQLFRMLVLGLGLAATSLGLGQQGAFPGRTFGFSEGLTNTSVMALGQGADGLIYAGTEGGLFRFDGKRFERIVLPPDHQFVTVLLAGQDRPLWVGTRNGLGWLDSQWGFHTERGPLAQRVHSLGYDAAGSLWAHVGDQLFLGTGTGFQPAPATPESLHVIRAFADPALPGVRVLAKQGIWILDPTANSWSSERLPHTTSGDAPLDFAWDGRGYLWVRTRSALWRRAPGGQLWTRLPGALSEVVPDHFGLARDRDGWLWINCSTGLMRCRGTVIKPVATGPRGYIPVTGMLDTEGSPWVASMGVTQVLGRMLWTVHDVDHGLPSNVVWTTLRDRRGRLWAATDDGLVMHGPTGWQVIAKGPFSRVRLHPDGSLLAVGSPGGMLSVVDPDSLKVQRHQVACMDATAVSRGLGVERDGTVWISDYRNGLSRGRKRGSAWSWEPGNVNGSPPQGLFEVVQDSTGAVYLPTKQAVYLREEGRWQSLGDTLPFTPLGAQRTPDGEIWVGYLDRPVLTRHRRETGGWRQVEAWWPFKDSEGLLVFSLTATPTGKLWVGTSHGLACLNPATHARTAWWTPGDGLPGADATTQGLFLEANGDLWFGCTSGLGCFRSAEDTPPPPLPTPILVSWTAKVTPGNPAGLLPKFEPQEGLESRFAIPSALAPSRLQLEARIPGIDPDWGPVDNNHLRYSTLPRGTFRLEARLRRDGETPGPSLVVSFQVLPRWWETWWAMALFLLGGAAGIFGVVRLRSRALERQNRLLQDIVATRTRDLQEANDDLTEANQFKSRFLATAAHDLKNPLTGILLQAELICEEAKGSRPDLEDRAQRLHDTGTRMLLIINGLLHTAAEEARNVTLQMAESNLPSLVHQVVAANLEYASSKGIRLSHQEMMAGECWGLVDEVQFRRAVDNLVNNAIKYSPPGTEVLVTSSPRVIEGQSWIEVLVSDQGPGLSAEDQAKAFGLYQRLSAKPTGGEYSTGLGLSIVKQMVELHGGRVWIESALGHGATFAIEIPLRAARHLLPSVSEESRRGSVPEDDVP